jgi:murein L,D-transpeptidase YcbB/YkuD
LYSGDPAKEEIIELDLFMTAAYMTMVSHLLDGRIAQPGTINKLWVRKTEDHRELDCLMALQNGHEFDKVTASMHPKHPFYKPLLRKFQEIRKSEEVKYHDFTFEEATEVVIGFTDPKIVKLRENLKRRGLDLRTDTNVVDSALIMAIKDFQQTRGIKVDGIPGENTLRYLNMSADELERLIALNLERMRWFPDGLEEEFLVVNIPEFMLRYYEGGEKQIEMKVVAGEIVNSTPVFSDTLTHIVFNPDWTVPQSIIHEEMIPKMVNNPSHYSNLNFSIYENGEEINPDTVDWASENIDQRYFGMVQNPGATNSLGLVKFMLPNSLSIYLHDTPADYLFERSERDFSHGCIRLERPFELAMMLLDGRPMWTKERVYQIIESGETEQVNLNDPIPVMISYITTWVDEEGNLRILEDIYGHDKRQLEKIAQL